MSLITNGLLQLLMRISERWNKAFIGIKREDRVGITEMWAYAVGYIMLYEYLGINRQSYPTVVNYWFKPDVVWDLYKNGLSLRDISQSMTENIVTLQSFKEKLIEDNKSHTTAINTIFRTHLTM